MVIHEATGVPELSGDKFSEFCSSPCESAWVAEARLDLSISQALTLGHSTVEGTN
jgi:hypothetical protein